MPIGHNLARCHACGTEFLCGDCIESECKECQCKRLGHLPIGDLCGRCGERIPIRNSSEAGSNPSAGAAQSGFHVYVDEIAKLIRLHYSPSGPEISGNDIADEIEAEKAMSANQWAQLLSAECIGLAGRADAINVDDIRSAGEDVIAQAIAAERQRIRDILWKTAMPGDWTEQAHRYVAYMVAKFDKRICGL